MYFTKKREKDVTKKIIQPQREALGLNTSTCN